MSWKSLTDLHGPTASTDLPRYLAARTSLQRQQAGEKDGYLLWVVNTLLPGLVGALLFGDIVALNSGDLLTLPHFSQGIILQTKIVVGNSRDVGIFFTNFIWNNLVKKKATV